MDKKHSGYVWSRHVFGNSSIGRNGDDTFFLYWRCYDKASFKNVMFITKEIYNGVKKLLLDVNKEQLENLTIAYPAITYIHNTSVENDEIIKTYLIKNNILKEKIDESKN